MPRWCIFIRNRISQATTAPVGKWRTDRFENAERKHVCLKNRVPEVQPVAELFWEGDSLDVVRSFPERIRKKLGEIRRVQKGAKPHDFKPMKSIGAKVFELRQRDGAGWYRTICFGVIEQKLFVLHSFIKKSANQ